jgi:hypothetical protein
MFVLDTNHVSELTYRTAAGLRLLQKLDMVNRHAERLSGARTQMD